MKLVSLIGVCKPLEAVFGIHEQVAEEDREGSCSRYVVSVTMALLV